MARIFGFEIKRVEPSYLEKDKVANDSVSFVDREADSTAAVLYSTPYNIGSASAYVDLHGNIKTEAEFINKYREMLNSPEVDNAIDEIVNEAIAADEEFIVKIDLEDIKILDPQAKLVISEQFTEILKLLDFNSMAYYIFRRWYIDGRLYYHAVIDPAKPQDGIKEVRYVDPRKLRLIKEVQPKQVIGGSGGGVADVNITKNEYYLYNEKGFSNIGKPLPGMFNTPNAQGIRISKDSIVHVPSGVTDPSGSLTIGYLHKAIKVLNVLRTVEDSLVIYRLARAPERRVWRVDVGNMPPQKANQYMKEVMAMQKNRLIYDADTGTIRDDRKFMTMLDDFWFPKWGDKGTDVQMLQGGRTLGEIDDIVYFQKLLYNSLNVPVDRLQPDTPFTGNTQEISRAEVKFDKFITRLRQQFSTLFTKMLERHLVLKGLMTIEEFSFIEKEIKYEFSRDNHFAELIDQQVLTSRIQTYMALMESGLIGKYFSNKWVRRNIFKQTDEDVIGMTNEIVEEMYDPLYAQAPSQVDVGGGAPGGGMPPDQASVGPTPSPAASQITDKQARVENAKSVVQALKGIKDKTPEEIKNLRSAAQTLSKTQ